MPIQVVASYKRIPPPPVSLVTAGDDVFPFCNITVTLTAVVNPEVNLPGHDVLWEQISGTAVILSSTTTLITTYEQLPNDETDKTFRVTIDPGLKEEQVDEVTVYATPTTLPTYGFTTSSSHYIPADPIENLFATATGIFDDPQNVRNAGVVVTPVFPITWDLPSDPILQPFVTAMIVYEDTGGSPGDVPVASFLPDDTLLYVGGSYTYHVIAEYSVNGQYSSADSTHEDFSTIPIPLISVVDEILEGPAYGLPDIVISRYPNVVKSYEDSLDQPSYLLNDVTGILYSINTFIDNESTPSTVGFSTSTTLIVRLDPDGIGGG